MKARDDLRILIFTFSSSVIITDEHFLAPGVLEKMVTFQCPAQNMNLFHPKVEGSKRETQCHYSLSGSQKHFLRTN